MQRCSTGAMFATGARGGRKRPNRTYGRGLKIPICEPLLGKAPIGEPYISITIEILFENSSDSDRGRRPEPKSDEFSK
eukprot:2350424-Prymnesium_polylepis.1